MVFPNEATKTLIDRFPGLQKSIFWERYYLFMDYGFQEEDLECCGIMTTLSMYVKDMLITQLSTEKTQEIKEIFALIEFFINEGDQGVQDAVATCFLENLINATSWKTLKPDTFLCYLGPESRAYCKAWDEFTGVKTPGLWSESEE